MNFKHKLGYMCIGCLFTIAGYIIASLGGMTTHAQQNEQVIDEIVCRKLKVVNAAGKEVAIIAATKYGGGIYVFNEAEIGLPVVVIRADKDGYGTMSVANRRGWRVATLGRNKEGHGNIGVLNSAGEEVATLGANKDGGGIVVRNAAGKEVVGIGTDKDGDGLIQSYKNGWRTH